MTSINILVFIYNINQYMIISGKELLFRVLMQLNKQGRFLNIKKMQFWANLHQFTVGHINIVPTSCKVSCTDHSVNYVIFGTVTALFGQK